jgi:hypothetical protein
MRVIRHGYLIEARRVGQLSFPRWFLRDSRHLYWTGSGWSPQRSKALTYADRDEVLGAVSQLMIETPSRKFQVKLTIVVDAARDFTADELRDYVQRNLRLNVKHDRGASSLDTASFHFNLAFDEMQEEEHGA